MKKESATATCAVIVKASAVLSMPLTLYHPPISGGGAQRSVQLTLKRASQTLETSTRQKRNPRPTSLCHYVVFLHAQDRPLAKWDGSDGMSTRRTTKPTSHRRSLLLASVGRNRHQMHLTLQMASESPVRSVGAKQCWKCVQTETTTTESTGRSRTSLTGLSCQHTRTQKGTFGDIAEALINCRCIGKGPEHVNTPHGTWAL